MSARTYSVIAVVEGGEQRLVLVTNDALRAFDLVSQMTLARRKDIIDVTEYRVYDAAGTLISQAQTRPL
jgi:hypothetical protein